MRVMVSHQCSHACHASIALHAGTCWKAHVGIIKEARSIMLHPAPRPTSCSNNRHLVKARCCWIFALIAVMQVSACDNMAYVPARQPVMAKPIVSISRACSRRLAQACLASGLVSLGHVLRRGTIRANPILWLSTEEHAGLRAPLSTRFVMIIDGSTRVSV